MTIHQLVIMARDRLATAGLSPETAAFDAELLARHALGWDRTRYLCERHATASPPFPAAYDDLVTRRSGREPVSLITGHREFWGLEFDVTPAVLTPRPETELIVEEALAQVNQRFGSLSPRLSILDIGTGSGCLAVVLARELPEASITATDVSRDALAVARDNAERHGVAERIDWHLTPFLEGLDRAFDLVVANPPYVPDEAPLPAEVRRFEPGVALFGGADGLDAIRELLRQAVTGLTETGTLIFELGFGQADGVCAIVAEHSKLSLERFRRDLQGIPRVAIIRKTLIT